MTDGRRTTTESDDRPLPHWYHPDGELPTIERADGVRVFDADGTGFLDFVSQLYCVNAGHGNEAITSAMVEQLGRVQYVSSAAHSTVRTDLARELARIAPGSLSEVYFAVSGSEANETAVQFAREYADAPKVLTRYRSYHGATAAAGGLTGDPSTRAAVESHVTTTGTVKFQPPIAHRSPFGTDDPAALAERAGDHLEYVVRNEGPDTVAAILMEPVGGTSGAYEAPPGYFPRVREICDEYDVLLIADEVITGFGRCGDWFAIGQEGVEPDLLTFAKGVTSAYAPLAGVLARPEVVAHVRDEGTGLGQTFGGHPVACAAGLAAIEEYRGGLIENVRDLESQFESRLDDLAAAHDAVADVRGRGFLRAVEFGDPQTGEPYVHPWIEPDADNPVAAVVAETRERGVLVGGGRPKHQVILAPPLCADADDLDEGVVALDAAIESVFG